MTNKFGTKLTELSAKELVKKLEEIDIEMRKLLGEYNQLIAEKRAIYREFTVRIEREERQEKNDTQGT